LQAPPFPFFCGLMDSDSRCFAVSLAVNLVGQLWQFTLPVIVPYGTWIGSDIETIAFFTTARGLGGVISNFWLPMFADGPKGANRPRRRAAVLFSLGGSALGYLLQGTACWFAKGRPASAVFLAGRFVVGLMSGMAPILSAYITDLCRDDNELLRWRFTALQASNSSAGIVLAPVAGALAAFGLELPFHVCTASSLIIFILAIFTFSEVTESPKKLRSQNSTSLEETQIEEKNPFLDPVVLMQGVAMAFIVVMVSGRMLLIPEQLAYPGFGLQGNTIQETQERVADATGLISIPSASLSLFANTFLFIPVTRRYGDVCVILVCGILLAVGFSLMGTVTSNIWIYTCILANNGLCMGLLFPVVGPLFARYFKKVFPTQQATAQSIGSQGVSISMLVAQVVVASVYRWLGLLAAWCTVGSTTLIFAVCLIVCCYMISSRIDNKLHPTQHAMMEALKPGKNSDKFIDEACALVREQLKANKDQLWNGTIQSVYKGWLSSPPARHSTNAQGSLDRDSYLVHVHDLLLKYCSQEDADEFDIQFNICAADVKPEDSRVPGMWPLTSAPNTPRQSRVGSESPLSREGFRRPLLAGASRV